MYYTGCQGLLGSTLVVYCGNGYARYARAARCPSRSKQLHALRDAEQAYLACQALAFADGPAEYASFRQSSKINISLTITKIAKW